MKARSPNWWPVLVALGVGFLSLNVVELVFLDGGAPQIVGVVLGFALVGLGIARRRGWAGVRR